MHVTKRFHAEELDLNITPMIDVVFLLLIFFLVVSEIASQDHIEDLQLPLANEAKEEQTLPNRLVISVSRKNGQDRIWIAGRIRTIDEVERYLSVEKRFRGAGKGQTRQPVLIQADRHAKWQTVQDIMEKASKLKFWRLSFSVKLRAPAT